ncbi:MAG: HRDC domain-containing protein [Phycisphaeraceae bacterium]|nr:HRDC domain-containing protein [Phycisphaeraceae bacterium]
MSHPMVPGGAPEMIVTPGDLESFVAHARGHQVLAFDTEFIGEESFRPRICLVQLATPERVALVDPFEFDSLEPIWELVADPAMLTVVHAGEQDVQAVRLALGRQPERLIDTQIAAAMVGMPWPCSLGAMVEQLVGHRPAKAHTFTNWDARPLTPSQLRYAADDVRYLPLAWMELERELDRRGRREWALRESEEVLAGDLVFDPARQIKRAARGESLKPTAMSTLREVILVRHALAEREDMPPRALLPDAVALELARRRPATKAQLGSLRGVPRKIVQDHADEILAAVERAKTLPQASGDPAALLEDASVRAEIDALWLAAQARCLALDLAPGLLMSRSGFSEWYAARLARMGRAAGGNRGKVASSGDGGAETDTAPSTGDPPLFAAGDWRREALGDWIERFVEGREPLRLCWRGGLRDLPEGSSAEG